MPSIFTSTKVFNRPIDHQSTSNDRLKPVMTTGLWSICILTGRLPTLSFMNKISMTSQVFSGKNMEVKLTMCIQAMNINKGTRLTAEV